MTENEEAELDRIQGMLEVRMKEKPRRYIHSLGVAKCARSLAETYGVDPYLASAAGLIHDWDKVLSDDELLVRAARYKIRVAGSPTKIVGLLHGPVAACELPEIFPELPDEVFQAVARHTLAATDMSDLDMVVFVADSIEPNRRGTYADDLRAQVGTVTLEELFFNTFTQGIIYVMQTGRYLYPSAVDIYNTYAMRRSS